MHATTSLDRMHLVTCVASTVTQLLPWAPDVPDSNR